VALLFFVLAQAALAANAQVVRKVSFDAEPAAYVVLQDIVIEGNRKTRRDIVRREMSLRDGDTLLLADLASIYERERRLLLNTRLFSEAVITASILDTLAHRLVLRAVVREKWYLYPGVDIDLADRNFNVWWKEQNRSLDRVNFGVNFRHNNITGRADRITLRLQAGYTRKAELRYKIPYIDRAKLFGLQFGVLFNRNREYWIRTEDAQLAFVDLDSIDVLRRQRYRIGLSVKPDNYLSHLLRVERQRNDVAPEVALDANPNFFGRGRREQNFWGLLYQVSFDRRDERPFPMRGFLTKGSAEKLGLGVNDDINRLQVSVSHQQFISFAKRLSLALSAKVRTDLVRDRVPYFNRVSLGFDQDFVRGYQFYVVDGLDYAYLKSTFRAKVFERDIRVPFSPIKLLQRIPVKLYLGVHADVGGTRDPFNTPGNALANDVLASAGVGAYGVFYYGKVIRVELTRNRLGELGTFVSYALGF